MTNHLVRRFDVTARLDGAVSLLGPDLGSRAATILLKLLDREKPAIVEIAFPEGVLLEYDFVSAFLGPLFDPTTRKDVSPALVLTCDRESDEREIKKGLIWNTGPTTPIESEWPAIIARLGRYVVLRDAASQTDYEYVGTDEPDLLKLLGIIERQGSLTVRDLVAFGWHTESAVDGCRELTARRQIILARVDGRSESTYLSIPYALRGDE